MSITALSAGLAIRNILADALKGQVTGVFPIGSRDNTRMPFVTYRRTGIQVDPTKDHEGIDMCTIDISVYSADYGTGVKIIEEIRDCLEFHRIQCTKADDGFDLLMDCTKMADCEEGLSPTSDAFLQVITFECKMLKPKPVKEKTSSK